MADESPSKETRVRKVDLVETAGEWFVHVTDGDQTTTHSFNLKEWAEAFAEGQRMRLGIDRIERI